MSHSQSFGPHKKRVKPNQAGHTSRHHSVSGVAGIWLGYTQLDKAYNRPRPADTERGDGAK
ncbi:MAG: hypothetical protein DRO11_06420 [Methanobacteriota archaeon]|nr:MAG: hypothetical protein DRO11_06420 [Euryarchaeota archaeon]